MTIIAGIAKDGRVFMGADRGTSDRWFVGSSLSPKIRKVGPYLIGYSGTRGVGQVLHFLQYPEPDLNHIERFIRMEFLRIVKQSTEELCTDVSDSEKNSAEILIGVAGHLFEINTEDWSVTEWDHIAIGSGYQYALGSLHATQSTTSQPKRLRMALEASVHYSPTCQAPFDLLTLTGSPARASH